MKKYLLWLLTLLMTLGGASAKEVKNAPVVLAVVSYHLTQSWTRDVLIALEEATPGVTFTVEELDVIRIPDEKVWQETWERHLPDLKAGRYAAVVTLDNTAAELVAAAGAAGELPEGLPVVVGGYSGHLEGLRKKWRELTGVEQVLDVEGNVRAGLKLFPEAKNVVSIIDEAAESSQYLNALTGMQGWLEKQGVATTILENKSNESRRLLDEVRALPPKAMYLLSPWRNLDTKGYQSFSAFAADLWEACGTPYFVFVDSQIGYGALGGIVTRAETHGQELATELLSVLAEGQAGKRPMVKGRIEPVFDWIMATSCGLDAKAFPEGTVWLHKPLTFWEKSRLKIINFGIALLVVLGVVGWWRWMRWKTIRQRQKIFTSLDASMGAVNREGEVLYLTMRDKEQRSRKKLTNLENFTYLNFPRFQSLVAQVFETGQPVLAEYEQGGQFRTARLAPLPKEVFGEEAVSWISYDNASLREERMRQDKAKAEWNEKLLRWNAVLDALPVQVYAKDPKDDFRYVMCNRALAEYWGLAKEDIIGKTDMELNPKYLAKAKEYREGEDAVWRGEHWAEEVVDTMVAPDGEVKYFQLHRRAFKRREEGGLLIGVALDVTGREEARTQLEKMNVELADLLAQNELLRNVLPVYIYARDVDDDFRYTLCNQLFAELLGVSSPEEVQGKYEQDLFSENVSLEELRNADRKAMEEEEPRAMEVRPFKRSDGTPRIGRFFRKKLRLQNGRNWMVVLVVDITDVETARQEKALALANLEMAGDVLRMAWCRIDVETLEFLGGSGMFRKIWPIRGEKIIPLEDVIDPSDAPRIREAYERAVHEDGRVPIHYRLLRENGEVRYYHGVLEREKDAKGRTCIFAVLQDSTDVVTTTGKLKEQQQLWNQVINTADGMYFAKEASEGFPYAQVNHSFATFFGMREEDFIGKCDADLFFDADTLAQMREQDKRLVAGENLPMFIERIRNKNGEERVVQCHKKLFPRPGRMPLILGLCVDVTENIRLTEENRVLQDQLNQAKKMDSLERAFGQTAHNFSNMLQAILGYAEVALGSLDPDHPAFGDVQSIRSAARRSAELTKTMLTFARQQDTEAKCLDLKEEISSAVPMLRQMVGPTVQLVVEMSPDPLPVRINPASLRQTLLNLGMNAREALIPERLGRILIETAQITVDVELRVQSGSLPAGEYARIGVTDNGIGMTGETIEKIFEPFFSTKTSGNGLGLGMPLIYGIIKQAKGEIQVMSRIGKGSTVYLYLPLVISDGGDKAAKKKKEAAASAGAGGHILLVDDDSQVLRSTRRMLESLGYTVSATTRAEEALTFLMNPHWPVDLLMTDVMMPGCNGPELVKRAKEIRPDLAYLYNSAFPTEVWEAVAKNEPCLSRPFTFEALAKIVHSFFSKANGKGEDHSQADKTV